MPSLAENSEKAGKRRLYRGLPEKKVKPSKEGGFGSPAIAFFAINAHVYTYTHTIMQFHSIAFQHRTLFIEMNEAGAPSTSHISPNVRLSESSSLTATMNLGEKFWSYSSGYSMRPNFILCVLTVLSPLVQLCVYVFF